jgi:hypothetical protein
VFIIEKIKIKKTLIDFKPFFSLDIIMTYKGETRHTCNYTITFNSKHYESIMNSKQLDTIFIE